MTIQGLPPFNSEAPSVAAEANTPSAVTEVAQAALGNFELLNEDARWQIAKRLEIAELLTLSCTSRFWNGFCNDDRIWRSIARKICFPLIERIPPKAQVLLFVSDLIKAAKAGKLTEDLKSTDKQTITVEQIAHLHQSVLSRDILMVWLNLGKALNPQATTLDIFGEEVDDFNSQQAIAKAKGFHDWFIAHENELVALERLDLSNCALFHLPEQLYRLTNLWILDLTNNQLRYLPAEICTLTELTSLYLKGNPLRCTEGETLNLPPKLEMSFGFFDGLPDELNLQIAAQIGLPVDRMRKNGQRTEAILPLVITKICFERLLPVMISGLFYNKNWRTISENRLMLEWKKASDTLTIWRGMSEKLTPDAPVENHFGKVEAYFEKARQFPEWLENNRAALARLPRKSVTLPGHIEIPEELKNHPALHQPIWAGKLLRELESNQQPRAFDFDPGVRPVVERMPETRNVQQYFVGATLMAVAAYVIYRLATNLLH